VSEIDLDAPAILLFTSGTSGPPRPAVLSYGNLYYNARGANANLRLHSQDRWLLNLPLYHVSGLGVVMRCLVSGAAMLIPDAREDLPAAMVRCRPSHVSLVPAQLHALLGHGELEGMDGVRVMLVGGSACSAETIQLAREQRWPVYLTYGLTEMASQVATVPPEAPPERRVTGAGRVLRHRNVRINADGEIEVAGPCLFLGYWNDGQIERTRTGDGWFATGDIGSLDEEGYLTVRGRRDGLIISGGENIQPEEVEDILRGGGDIDEVVVVPVPHAKYGQRPVAFVRAAAMDPAGWARRIAGKTAAFKIPDVFYPWPDDAPSITMKPPRRWFRERAEALVAAPGR
jgi:O-succinylbenzoic acid--CoA ligase